MAVTVLWESPSSTERWVAGTLGGFWESVRVEQDAMRRTNKNHFARHGASGIT
jgi:hypothetical protein